MNPDQFREIRLKINRLCKEVSTLADNNDEGGSKNKLNKAGTLLEELSPQAEGEIQVRSVKNLGMKINAVSVQVDKIKPAKKAGGGSRKSAPAELIDWDEARLSQLSDTYLFKLLANMGSDKDSQVCLSTSGKGVKPSYQIKFGTGESSAFSGSSHKPLKRDLPRGSKQISQPFSHSIIESTLSGKSR